MDLREISAIPEPVLSRKRIMDENKELIDRVDFMGSFGGVIKGKIIVGYYCMKRILSINLKRYILYFNV